MRLDYRKWTDIYDVNFLDNDGLLTDAAVELMGEYNCYTLDELLHTIEQKGEGYFYGSDVNRPDVNIKGHDADINNPESEFYHLK